MVKYPLSKEPIDAELSANDLKKAQKNLEESFNLLKNSALNIQSNLEGEEFQGATNYIGKILEKINESSANINNTLQKISNEINEYNSQIVDADGNPYYSNKVNYGSNSSNMNTSNVVYGVNYSSSSVKNNIIDIYNFSQNQAYDVNATITYNNKTYVWNDVVGNFLNEIGYKNLVNNISVKNGVATCYLQNGNYFIINGVNNFNDIKTGIIDYFSKNYI